MPSLGNQVVFLGKLSLREVGCTTEGSLVDDSLGGDSLVGSNGLEGGGSGVGSTVGSEVGSEIGTTAGGGRDSLGDRNGGLGGLGAVGRSSTT
jgi:hypothetical protein